MKDRGFYAWIIVFAVVVSILVWSLSPSSSAHPSIGGGGYDLSTGLNHSKARTRCRAFILAAIGLVTFSASIVIWGNNLG